MRFYNSGKYEHVTLNSANGEYTKTEHDLKPKGHEVGTAIVNFPGIGITKKIVAKGDWVVLLKPTSGEDNREMADEEWAARVKAACPSLLTEQEAAGLEPAKPAKPAKGEGK